MKKITIGVLIIIGITIFLNLFYQEKKETRPNITEEIPKRKSSKEITPFSMNSVNKGPLNLTELHDKIIIINFWATWCPPCISEIPDLVKIQNKWGRKVQIVGIALDNNETETNKLISKLKINYPIVYHNSIEKHTSQFGQISSIPTTFFLNRGLVISKRIVGQRNFDEFNQEIEALTP